MNKSVIEIHIETISTLSLPYEFCDRISVYLYSVHAIALPSDTFNKELHHNIYSYNLQYRKSASNIIGFYFVIFLYERLII